MALVHLEDQVVWLAEKIRRDKKLIEDAEEFFDEKQYDWSRGVLSLFMCKLEKMKDQLYYDDHQLEILSWQVVEAREGRTTDVYALPNESNFAMAG